MTSNILSGTPHKRRRRSNSQIADLRSAILDVLRADHPQSVRHVYYRLTDPRLNCAVEKTENGYEHVQRQLSQMRKEGALSYSWITDSTRMGYFVDTFDDAADFLERVSGLYRIDAWKQAGHYTEVWCESRSIAGVIRPLCQEFGISLYPAGGFTSITLPYEAATDIDRAVLGTERSIEILYVGDFDQAGVLIDRDIEAKLRGHLRTRNEVTFHRVAINEDQVLEFDLPKKQRKENDKRAPQVKWTVEAEALPAHILRDLLRAKIESFLPEQALQVAKVAEQSERDYLNRLAALMKGEGA